MTMRPLIVALFVAALTLPSTASAASKKKIDRRVGEALEEFHEVVKNADDVLSRAKGILVFPNVKKAGIGIGGETGNGALLIGGEPVQYYNTSSASIGLQLGFQVRRQMIVFLSQSTLDNFRDSSNWEIGVDGSVALVTLDAGGEVDTQSFDKPAIAFVYGGKGLMYNLTLEGTKISKIDAD